MKEFKIKSFVKRVGRLTKFQQNAIDNILPKHTLSTKYDRQLDLKKIFNNNNQIHLEIGIGNGEALIDMALANPNINYIGIEVHDPGIGHTLIQIDDLQLTNIKLAHHDATEVIKLIPSSSLSRVMLFFPDPWHKKKHNKRRIIRSDFMNEIIRCLQISGVFHMATDWQDYAEQALKQINSETRLNNLDPNQSYLPRPSWRTLTKFEKRGHRLGHGVWDMMWKKTTI